MTDNRNDAARAMSTEVLSSLFKVEGQEKLFQIPDDEIDALERLSPDEWPTAGPTEINWDLSITGRKHTIALPDKRILQPVDCTPFDLGS